MKKLLFLIITLISIFSLSSCNKVFLNSEKNIDDKIILTKRNAISSDGKTISVTATINPSTAIDKECTWSLVYVDGSSTTYITSYVSYSVSSDTLTCTLTKKMTFVKQMKLICTLKSNSTISAYCLIDNLDRNFGFYKDCFTIECSSSNTLSEIFVGENNIFNTNYYETNGGTLNTTVKNIKIVDGWLDSDYEEGYINESKFYSLALYEYEGQGAPHFECTSWITMSCDLYYGNTLILSGVETTIEFYLSES